jgi:hypothetical protein
MGPTGPDAVNPLHYSLVKIFTSGGRGEYHALRLLAVGAEDGA